MVLLDVNVLVHAHRADAQDHRSYRAWLEGLANGDEAFAVSDLVLSGFLRVVTHPKVFSKPTPLSVACAFVEEIRSCVNCVTLAPGPRHWEIFVDLALHSNSKGNHLPDAFHAALAIESGCEWVTTDRGFGRFKALRWRHPFE